MRDTPPHPFHMQSVVFNNQGLQIAIGISVYRSNCDNSRFHRSENRCFLPLYHGNPYTRQVVGRGTVSLAQNGPNGRRPVVHLLDRSPSLQSFQPVVLIMPPKIVAFYQRVLSSDSDRDGLKMRVPQPKDGPPFGCL